ncbi:MAG: hypothetical protein Q8M29_07900 [Bacteroidota bacterium]|nr:hypothetical protein [Bacteroidota bacterium]
MYNSIAYIIYLLCSLFVVIWIGRILHRNGKLFLEETCPDKQLADSTNNILYVCYCLMNSGFAFYHLNSFATLKDLNDVIEFIATSEGFILITLGVMHFLNMLIVPKIIMFFADTSKLITNPSDETKKSDIKSTHHEL